MNSASNANDTAMVAAGEPIWVLTIAHRTPRGRIGIDVWARRDRADLAMDLYRYVEAWWADEIDEPIPTPRDSAIRKYFAVMAGKEWWETTQVDLT